MTRHVHIAATLPIEDVVTLSLHLRQRAADLRSSAYPHGPDDPLSALPLDSVRRCYVDHLCSNADTLDRVREALESSAVDA